MNYNRINNLTGWLVFLIATVCYLLTVAPTASFWDCGEFIAVSNELEVPHPPGAPMYLLLGRLFAIFASSPETVAYMVNLLSVFASAFTVLFIFWIITALGKKVLAPGLTNEPTTRITISLMFAGAVGALANTFIDSFWFNAVEAEVYALSSFFTALVVWLMLKWEARADESDNLKWIILIAYMMGISIGVHLLNLLAIPALGLIYYFKKYKFSWQGLFTALLISGAFLYFFNNFVIKTTFEIAEKFETIFTGDFDIKTGITSGLGMPYGTGTIIMVILFVGLLGLGLYYSHKKNNAILNTVLITVVMTYIGLSSYALILVRSNAEPPINENNPSNIVTFIQYMKREQYGDWNVTYGPMYHATIADVKEGAPIRYKFLGQPSPENFKGFIPEKFRGREKEFYEQLGKRYVIYDKKQKYIYTPGSERFFPRMHSREHYQGKGGYSYKEFVKNKGENPNDPRDDKPTGLENLRFFFEYQLNYMYIRYFMWNFVGREGDRQGEVDDWESGINRGKLNELPEFFRNDPARNHYFFLPLILGLLGLAWHTSRSRHDALVVGTLFFFTGVAIILYLNQTPQQPRERDYSYAGSFQTFCIWIGLGVLGLTEMVNNKLKGLRNISHILVGPVCLLLVPLVLAVQNWDDHSRAGNYVAPDSAYNMLIACEPNGLLFTNGDNDTFPLWYLQEVEGIRTDVRIVNLSLLNTDWYIHQLKFQCNKSAPLPVSLPESEYMGEVNGMKILRNGENFYGGIVSSKDTSVTITIPVDKKALITKGLVKPQDSAKIEAPMRWRIKLRPYGDEFYLMKQDLMIVDLLVNIAKNGWDRPFYFSSTIPPSSFLSLQPYFRLEGMGYRVLPVKDIYNPEYQTRMDTEIMYDIIMKRYKFRNLDNPDIYYDSNTQRMISNFRQSYYFLSSEYINNAKMLEYQNAQIKDKDKAKYEANLAEIDRNYKKAVEVVDFIQAKVPDNVVRAEPYFLTQYAKVYSQAGKREACDKLLALAREHIIEEWTFERARNPKWVVGRRDLNVGALQEMFYMYVEELNDLKAAEILANDFLKFANSDMFLQQLKQLKTPTPTQKPESEVKK